MSDLPPLPPLPSALVAPPAADVPDPFDTLATAGLEGTDPRTHLERINPGDNPAWAPGTDTTMAPISNDRGEKKFYLMLTKGVHDGMLFRPGDTVMLYDDEVGAQHQLLVRV